jgi:thioredoxin reductase
VTDKPDLLIIGAGPAGMEAAIAASRRGLSVVIVDEAAKAGGQIYRPLPEGYKPRDLDKLGPDFAAGEKLRADLAASSADCALGCRVWRIAPGFEVEAVGPDGLRRWTARAVIAATGASERIIPFRGWTLPGVIGLAAATIMLKSQQVVPAGPTVVAGCGPLVAAVAVGILKGGGQVAAMIDLASSIDWLTTVPAMMARTDLLRRGLGWMKQIQSAGVPILFRHGVVEARGDDNGLRSVVVKPVDASGKPIEGAAERTYVADCLAVGHGLVPSTEITRVFRAKHAYREDRGGWIVDCDDARRTSIPGLYVCGDGAGISGAAAAALQGRLAGLTVALDQGKIDKAAYDSQAAEIRRDLEPAERFGRAMARMMALRPAMTEAITGETVVCRCEDVTRAEIEDAIATGAIDVNHVKSWTRAGMGPCQGRICGEAIGTLCAAHFGGRERAGLWTGRLPLRPVSLGAIVGDYDYEKDIYWQGRKAAVDDEGNPWKPPA